MAKFKYTKDREYDIMRGLIIDDIRKMKKAKMLLKRITRSENWQSWSFPESRLVNARPKDLPNKSKEFLDVADTLRGYLNDEIQWFEYALKYANKEELKAFLENKLTPKQVNDIQHESRWR